MVIDHTTLLFVAAGVLLVLSGVLVYYYKTTNALLAEMWAVHPYDARDLERLCSGDFDAVVEVQGEVSCDEPLTSLSAGAPCCWFRTIVKRESETTYVTKSGTQTDRSWVTAFDRTFAAVFKVTDETGFSLVDPTDADIDTVDCTTITMQREPWFEEAGYSDTGRYQIIEKIFFAHDYAFILGQASSTTKGVLIHYPKRGYLDPKKKFFIISRKSERQLAKSKQTTTTVCFWFSLIALLVAAYFALAAFGIAPAPFPS